MQGARLDEARPAKPAGEVWATRRDRPRWYRSFYWRIGVSFVAFLIAVLVAQSIMARSC